MKTWVWYLIGAIVFVLAGGGVLYGVLTHKEPGLMKVCWTGGQAVYAGADCTTELKWTKQRLPLKYAINFDAAHKDYVNSVKAGADLWNKEIGTPLFVFTDKVAEAKIIVEWGSVSGNAGGYTSHKGTTGPESATITLTEATDIHAVYRYAAHEFGHVLGLAHDDFESSIMFPTQPGMTGDMKLVLPSDADKKLLQGLYR